MCILTNMTLGVPLYTCSAYYYTRITAAILVSAVGFVLNCLMALLILWYKRPLNAQNRLVLNLCLNNLAFCGYVMPVYVYDLSQGMENQWGVFCRIHGFIFMYVQCNVILAYLHITLHRYFTTVFYKSPNIGYGSAMKTRLIITGTTFILAVLMSFGVFGIWGQYGQSEKSGVCSLLREEEGGHKSFNMFGHLLAVLLPLVTMAYCYGHILCIVRRQQVKLLNTSPSFRSQTSESRQRRRETYVTLVSIVILAVFVASYVPYVLARYIPALQDLVVFQAIAGALAYIHALTDPIIYVLGDHQLRKHLKGKEIPCCRKVQDKGEGEQMM